MKKRGYSLDEQQRKDRLKLFLTFQQNFKTDREVAETLNAALKTNYDANAVGNWRRGAQTVPGIVHGFLKGKKAKK